MISTLPDVDDFLVNSHEDGLENTFKGDDKRIINNAFKTGLLLRDDCDDCVCLMLNVICRFEFELRISQKDLESEYQDILNKHFWEFV